MSKTKHKTDTITIIVTRQPNGSGKIALFDRKYKVQRFYKINSH